MRRCGILALFAVLPAMADTTAVLAFWNTSIQQPNLDWIGVSIAETIRESLGTRGLLTLDRDEMQDAFERLGLRGQTALSDASVLKIGDTVDAEQVIFGTFEFTPDNDPSKGAGAHGSLKITARILDRRKMRLGPQFSESGALEDLATLQAHLAWRALAVLAPDLAPPESEFRSVRTPIRLDAEENYVRGLLARDPAQKEQLFLNAAHLDARFGDPCYQLGQIHYKRKEYREAAEWLEKISAEDTHYREAQFLLGLALYQTGDFAGAQKDFQIIAAVVPLDEVWNNLGAAESRLNLPQAVAHFRKAAQGDPADPLYQFNLGYALWKSGDFIAASENLRNVLSHDSEDTMATLLLGRCLQKQGYHAATDARLSALERLKTDYEERAYWQLKAMLSKKAQ
ncbi:MAG TPA: tetratricopeptide repeat protein [Bryobacteraceae bacterium]|nr:tetratricopeptide repeat protein [Bryobacteraceae bacterium]